MVQLATAPITRSIQGEGTDGLIGRQAADLPSSPGDQRSLSRKPAPIQSAGLNAAACESVGGEGMEPGGFQTARTLL